MSAVKEPRFFDSKGKLKKGMDWYLARHFNAVGEERAVGEASPRYLWSSGAYGEWHAPEAQFASLNPETPENVLRLLGPDVKLLVVLRDPVKRAMSAYLHHLRQRRIRSEIPFLESGRRLGIIHRGFYGAHLQRWFEVFPRSTYKILVFERAIRDSDAAFAQVYQHIGVDPTFQRRDTAAKNAGAEKFEHEGHVYVQAKRFRTRRSVRRLVDRARRMDPGSNPEAFQLAASREDLLALYDIYREDIAHLQDLLDDDLAPWAKNEQTLRESPRAAPVGLPKLSTEVRRPKFLVLGATEGGLPWLVQTLQSHPDVYLPDADTEGFFDGHAGNAREALESYFGARNRAAPASSIVGEAAASYMRYAPQPGPLAGRKNRDRAKAPQRALGWLGPEVRLLAILRDPVEHVIQDIARAALAGSIKPGISIQKAPMRTNIIADARFSERLSGWVAHFGKRALVVLIAEEVAEDPKAARKTLRKKLGLTSVFPAKAVSANVAMPEIPIAYDAQADGYIERDGERQRIVTAADRAWLEERFQDDIAALEHLVGRAIPAWRRNVSALG